MDPLILGALGLGDLAQLAGWLPKSVLQGLSVAIAVYVAARWLMLGRLQRRVAAPGVTRSTLDANLRPLE